MVYETQGITDDPAKSLGSDEINYLDSLNYEGIMNLNIQYAISHRERVMKTDPISFPEYELLDDIIKPYIEDPYYHMKRDKQMRLEAAAVRRRFLSEQEERNKKIQREYLRMLNKRMHLGYLSPQEAFLEPDDNFHRDMPGAEWHISYYSDKDYKRIEAVMKEYGCNNYTLYSSIDECISVFEKNDVG